MFGLAIVGRFGLRFDLGILNKEKGSSVFTWQLNSFPFP